MVAVHLVKVVKDFLVGLPLPGTASLLLSEKPIKRDTLCLSNNIANLGIFCGEKVGALGQFLTGLYLPVAIFLAVTLKDWGIKVAYIRPYSSSLGLIIMAFIVTAAVVGVPVR